MRTCWFLGLLVRGAGPAEELRSRRPVRHAGQELLVKLRRLAVGLVSLRLLRGLHPDRHGIVPPVCSQQVECEVDRGGAGAAREHICRDSVELFTPRRDHVVVDRLAGKGMPEPVLAVVLRLLLEQLLLDARVKRGLHRAVILRGHCDEHWIAKGPAQHRRRLENVRLLWRQLFKTQEDGVAHGLREAEVLEALALPAI